MRISWLTIWRLGRRWSYGAVALFDKRHQVNRIVKFDMYPLYTRCAVYIRYYAYRKHFFSGQIFTRCTCIYSPGYSASARPNGAYNRINAVIWTSLQCNSLALQSSRVFTPSCLCLFYFQNIIFTGDGPRWNCFQKIYIWCSAARRVLLCKKIIVTPRFAKV